MRELRFSTIELLHGVHVMASDAAARDAAIHALRSGRFKRNRSLPLGHLSGGPEV
jgi:hypothetical protein